MEYSLNIALIEPEIPQNTGNIARTCAATGARLHLVEPMGFKITDKQVKRAGLDYWDKLDITYYNDIDEFFERNKGAEFFYFTTKAEQAHSDIQYPNNCFLVFGKETKGLPEELLKANHDRCVRLPMRGIIRSLNLANSVCAGAYEANRGDATQWQRGLPSAAEQKCLRKQTKGSAELQILRALPPRVGGLTCRLGWCFCFAEVSTGHPHHR